MKRLGLLVLLMVFVPIISVFGLFEEIPLSAKLMGMGNANTGLIGEPAGVFFNPASIVNTQNKFNLLLTYSIPYYGIDYIVSTTAGLVVNISKTLKDFGNINLPLDSSIGIGYVMNGVMPSYGGIMENRILLDLAGGIKVFGIQTSLGLKVGLYGANISKETPGISPENINTSISAISVSVGSVISPVEFLNIGILGENLYSTGYSFFPNSSSQFTLPMKVKIGLTVIPLQYMIGVVEYTQPLQEGESSSLYFGMELNYLKTIFIRAGLWNNNLSGGLGINIPLTESNAGLEMNVGFISMGDLGLQYKLELMLKY